jgi:hypothetical protein
MPGFGIRGSGFGNCGRLRWYGFFATLEGGILKPARRVTMPGFFPNPESRTPKPVAEAL